MVHFFKKMNDKKPYQSLSLSHGQLTQEETEVIIDEETGEECKHFKFQFMSSNGKKKKGKLMTVLPE